MSYEAFSKVPGRKPYAIVLLRLDGCPWTYGVGPCTATGGPGQECYNTFGTCQALAAYLGFLDKLYYLVSNDAPSNPWLTTSPFPFIPCIESVKINPPRLAPGKGLGVLGSVTIKIQDVISSDGEYLDPYIANRATPAAGTFFRRMLARNPHYAGRQMSVSLLYGGGELGSDDLTYSYIIDKIDGPDKDGKFTITGRDPLILTDGRQGSVPLDNVGTLTADMTVSEIAGFNINETAATFEPLQVVRIDDEMISYIGYAAGGFTFLGRGVFGTVAAAHDAGAAVQQVKRISSRKVTDMVAELLLNYTGISPAQFPASERDPDGFLESIMVEVVIAEPTSVAKLIDELAEQCGFHMWWDAVDGAIKLRALAPKRPIDTVAELTDENEILINSLTVKRDPDDRTSRVFIYYGEINAIEGENVNNYEALYVQADLDSESPNAYNSVRLRVIKSRWFGTVDYPSIMSASGRMITRLSQPPYHLLAAVDESLDISEGDTVNVTTERIVDFDGVAKTFPAIVTEVTPTVLGHRKVLRLQELTFSGRYGFIAPDATPLYGAASQLERDSYSFTVPSTLSFADGTKPYKVY